MEFRIEQAIEILRTTPHVLRASLKDISDSWVHNNYGESTFSPYDIVGHLIHGERTDWFARAKIILEHGDSKPFEPFDRYAMYEDSKGKTITELLYTFEELRRENIESLTALSLSEQQLDLRGTHPELGPLTLRNLLAMWAVHDLNHIAQMAKSIAYQYRDKVGPFLDYASILKG